ncbi:unnamed protein product, partial [Meganyctiphanes norvegica]
KDILMSRNVFCRECIETGGDGSWWGWIQDAKDKVIAQSSEVLEFVKKDVEEFTKVVSEETSAVVSATAGQLKTQLRRSRDYIARQLIQKRQAYYLHHIGVASYTPENTVQSHIVPTLRHIRYLVDLYLHLNKATEKLFSDKEEGEEGFAEKLQNFLIDFKIERILNQTLSIRRPFKKKYYKMGIPKLQRVSSWLLRKCFCKMHKAEITKIRKK